MRKTYWIILVVVCLLGLIGYITYRLKGNHVETVNVYDFFPANTSAVIHVNHTSDIYQSLHGANMMWDDLITVPFWNVLDQWMHTIDLFAKSSPNKKALEVQVTIGFYKISDTSFTHLIALEIPQNFSLDELSNALKIENIELDETYLDQEIYSFGTSSKEFMYQHKNILVFSTNKKILTQSIQGMQTFVNLSFTEFKNVCKMSSRDSDFNLFLHIPQADIFINNIASPKLSFTNTTYKKYGKWLVLDASIKPNTLTMSGFLNDSSHQTHTFIQQFEQQKPISLSASKYMPKSTFFSYSIGLSNFEVFQQTLLQKITENNEYIDLLELIENEIAYCSFKEMGINHSVVFMQSNDAQKAFSFFSGSSKENIVPTKDSLVVEKIIGTAPIPCPTNYVTIIDEFIVFSSSKEALVHIEEEIKTSNTLITDASYKDFMSNFSNTQNILIYIRPSINLSFFEQYLSEQSLLFINLHDYLFQKLDFIGIQLSTEKKGLLYANLALKYSQNIPKSPALLWEFAPDEAPKSELFVFSNHNTSLKEVFFQDQNDQIYLLSTAGKQLWKRAIEESIVGKIHEVDALKNKKYQILFSTSSKLYLIDRNGKDVPPFPIKLPAKTSIGVQCMDYEKNKEYRLLVACQDKNIYNYQISGKKVDGFTYKAYSSDIHRDIQHNVVQNKDYISVLHQDGTLHMIERKGMLRLPFKSKIELSEQNNFSIVPGENIALSSVIYSDATGTIHKVYFDQHEDVLSIKNMNPSHYFSVIDLNNDKKADYLLSENNTIQVFDDQKNLLLDIKSDSTISSSPFVISMDGVNYIVYACKDLEKIYLVNNTGILAPGFPLEGRDQITISDINNDKIHELITTTSSGFIRVYSLEDVKGYGVK